MRRMIALVPLAVVGGYLALAARDRQHTDHSRHVIQAADAPAPAAGFAHSASVAPELAVAVKRAQVAAHTAEAHAKAAQARGAAQASGSITVSLDGLLRVITRELERSALDSEAVVLEDLRISATLLADLGAELHGLAEIRMTDSTVAIVGTSDGGRVHVAVER